jgi:hypothetical protein
MQRARAAADITVAPPGRRRRRRFGRLARVAATAPIGASLAVVAGIAGASSASAAATAADSPISSGWCSAHGSSLVGWTGTVPDLPICGEGPAYGGAEDYVDLPGPGGNTSRYFGATPGFQCVELADRFLAVVYGLAPVIGNGESVAANYHAEYPFTRLYVNGTPSAVGHAPQPGDILSLSSSPTFQDGSDGHVAVVVRSAVDSAGNGSIVVAEENVSSADYWKTISVIGWRLVDPDEPPNPEFQFPYAEWLHVGPIPSIAAQHERIAIARLRLREQQATLRLAHRRARELEGERFGLLAIVRTVSNAALPSAASPFIRPIQRYVTTGLLLQLRK